MLVDAALAIAAKGIPVFPCGATKAPLTRNGFKDATTDADTLRRLFSNAAAKMIGMPTGAITGIVVIDVDVKENRQGTDWLYAQKERLVQTRTNRTGSGGLHLIFEHPGKPVKNQNDKIAPGIDVRGDGGYIIVPPSPGYEVADNAPIAKLPPWLIEALCPPEPAPAPAPTPSPYKPVGAYRHDGQPNGGTHYGIAALDEECDAIRRAGFGNQERTLNDACVKVGGLVAGRELEERHSIEALYSAAVSMPSQGGREPWNPVKLRGKIDKAVRDGMATPRQAPEGERIILPENHPAAAFLEKINREHAQTIAKPLPVAPGLLDVDGVLKLIMDECLRTAIRPQPFLALGAAICAVGVLAGRRYRNRTDLRTNIYVAAVAESGGGKDHAPEIVRRTLSTAGLDRYLGGETLASGRALLSSLEQHPARLFQVDELGLFLKTVTGKHAPGHKADIWAELMKLYSRAKGVYLGTEYANQKENARVNLQSPHAAFYGTTTPSTFWSALEGGALLDGSLARFLIFITDDDRPARNTDPGIFAPSQALLDGVSAIAAGAAGHDYGGNLAEQMMAQAPMTPYTVPETKPAADLHRKNLAIEDEWARKVAGTPSAAIVNRLAENAAKLALVRAISRAPAQPIIGEIDVAWGWALAEHCTRTLLANADRYIASSEYEMKLQRAREIIRKHGPMTERDMIRQGFKLPERERREVLQTLAMAGLIRVLPGVPTGERGRPAGPKYVITATEGDQEDE
jgi:hypothetical protein